MSALRERIRTLIEAHVRAVAPAAMTDLWGRQRVSVLITEMQIGPATGRPGDRYTPCSGEAQARLIAEHPEDLPDERLWARLAGPHTLPAQVGSLRAPNVALTGVRESISGDGWCEQSLTFTFAGDFVGVEI